MTPEQQHSQCGNISDGAWFDADSDEEQSEWGSARDEDVWHDALDNVMHPDVFDSSWVQWSESALVDLDGDWRSSVEEPDALLTPDVSDVPPDVMRALLGGRLTPAGSAVVAGGAMVNDLLRPDTAVLDWRRVTAGVSDSASGHYTAHLFVCSPRPEMVHGLALRAAADCADKGLISERQLLIGNTVRQSITGSSLMVPAPSDEGSFIIVSLKQYDNPAQVALDPAIQSVMFCEPDGTLRTMVSPDKKQQLRLHVRARTLIP